jgi:D-alanyl-lipoteichoic acid acyltransferase DltB (MBOAT superfamily)
MLFNSLHFLAFFPVVVGVLFLLPHRVRWAWLLIASCYFYMAFIPAYILILFCVILVDYAAGIIIEKSEGARRKLFLILSLLANIGILGFFKYYNFAATNLGLVSKALGLSFSPRTLEIILPIGLSFHTFQSMSYTIEVYLRRQRAERHLGIYALYVLFWPQLVAGPIERPQNLLHQFRAPKSFDMNRARDGAVLMLVGFAKKVLVADTLARTVNPIYGDPASHSGLALIVATYFFAFQIYCDFSGYSDIARGAARIMGFELMVNFDRPYASTSISEFWRRWHISLSTWFRDYLYVPLGGSRVSRHRAACNLLVVFLVSGLWHGANWTFLCWGAIHGVVLAVTQLAGRGQWKARPAPAGVERIAKQLFTFHIVVLSWIFFRAESVSQAFYILGHLGSKNGAASWSELPITRIDLALAVSAIIILEVVDKLLAPRLRATAPSAPFAPGFFARTARLALVVGVIILVLLRLTDDHGPQQFIYFQF